MDTLVFLFDPGSTHTETWREPLAQSGYLLEEVDTPAQLAAQLEAHPTIPVLVPASVGTDWLAEFPPQRLPHLLVLGESAQEVGRFLERGLTDFVLLPLNPTLLRVRIEARRTVLRAEEDKADIARTTALKLIERDVEIGRDIQQSFLPEALPQPEGWDLDAFFRPAREVAGDFYDGFELLNKRRVGIVMADVCDKGVPAAIFMALFRTLIRAGAQQNISLSWADGGSSTDDKVWLGGGKGDRRQALPRIGTSALMNAVSGTNAYMTENHLSTGYFVTLFFGIFDPQNGSLLYINGGHNPPVLIRTDGSHTLLKPTGPAVGMIPGAQFRIGQEVLNPGDVLFTYTDGVPEAKDEAGHFFGFERTLALLLERRIVSAQELVGRMHSALDAHIGAAPQFDDITMLALRRADSATPDVGDGA